MNEISSPASQTVTLTMFIHHIYEPGMGLTREKLPGKSYFFGKNPFL